MKIETLKAQIRKAFARARYPGDDKLRGVGEGDEPFCVERDFRGKRDWQSLSAQFIDQSPDGLASALSFFSNEAFRFYLPAYLLADLDGQLQHSDPLFHLTYGLDRQSAQKRINRQRYGAETWSGYAQQRFAGFTREEAAAIVAYLEFKRSEGARLREVGEALESYWRRRAAS
jgi:Family of unknown function (DUF6714)